MTTLRDVIRSSKKPRRAVEVPAWGVTVYVRAISAAEYHSWYRRCEEKKAGGQSDTPFNAALMLVTALEEEDGSPVFTEQDLDWLQREAGYEEVFDLYHAASDHNALTKERREDIRKNSSTAAPTAASSPTNSPAPTTAST